MAPSPWPAAIAPSSWSTGSACRSLRRCRSRSCSAPLIGFVLERTLYVHVYRKPPSRPGAVHHRPRLHVGRGRRLRHGLEPGLRADCQAGCRASFNVFGVGIGRYRLLIIVICGLLTIGLQLILANTRFGSRLRAAVDDRARRARARHQRQRASSRSPSRSARGSPAWAARSAPKSSGSIRPSRSNS